MSCAGSLSCVETGCWSESVPCFLGGLGSGDRSVHIISCCILSLSMYIYICICVYIYTFVYIYVCVIYTYIYMGLYCFRPWLVIVRYIAGLYS